MLFAPNSVNQRLSSGPFTIDSAPAPLLIGYELTSEGVAGEIGAGVGCGPPETAGP